MELGAALMLSTIPEDTSIEEIHSNCEVVYKGQVYNIDRMYTVSDFDGSHVQHWLVLSNTTTPRKVVKTGVRFSSDLPDWTGVVRELC